jgi:hypothetical protein
VGQEQLGPSYFFISLVLGPLKSLVWYLPSLRYTYGLGWRIHCGVEVFNRVPINNIIISALIAATFRLAVSFESNHADAEILREEMSSEALPCHSTRKSSAFRAFVITN